MPSYQIHDNGGRPFEVEIEGNDIDVYAMEENHDEFEEWEEYGEDPILQIKGAREIFVGNSPENSMTRFSGGYGPDFYGNSILVKIDCDNYIYIGREIYEFNLLDGEVTEYISPVGNSDVPYPYAITDTGRIYLMLEKVYLLTEEIDKYIDSLPQKEREALGEVDDPYDFYYGNFLSQTKFKKYKTKHQRKLVGMEEKHKREMGHPYDTKILVKRLW